MSSLISYRNKADGATLTGSATAGFPLTNLQSRQLSSTWRADKASNPKIVIDFGASPAPLRVVGFIAANRVGRDPATSSDFLTEGSSDGVTWLPWPNLGSVGENGVPSLPNYAITLVQAPSLAPRYVRLTPKWLTVGNAPYYEAARLWMADAIVLQGVDTTWSLGFIDPGKLDTSAGGQAYASVRPRVRQLRLSLGTLSTAEAYGIDAADVSAGDVPSLQDMQMSVGTTGEVFVLPRTPSALWMRRLGIYGHFSQPFEIQHRAGAVFSTELNVVEER